MSVTARPSCFNTYDHHSMHFIYLYEPALNPARSIFQLTTCYSPSKSFSGLMQVTLLSRTYFCLVTYPTY